MLTDRILLKIHRKWVYDILDYECLNARMCVCEGGRENVIRTICVLYEIKNTSHNCNKYKNPIEYNLSQIFLHN